MLHETDVDALLQLSVNTRDAIAPTMSNKEVMMGRLEDFKFIGLNVC